MAGALEVPEMGNVRFNARAACSVGDHLELVGRWDVHPKYGRQFVADIGIVRMDESADALANLLATHKDFEGLGPARARRVVDAALELTVDGRVTSALIGFPEEIAARSGVALSIVHNAAAVWSGKQNYFAALAALAEQGWTNAQADKIIKLLGEGAPSIVRQDPYFLIGKLPRFGFRTVDAVALKMGIASTDPHRLQYGVAYCLDRIAENGSTWTTRRGLFQTAVEELRPDTLDGEDKIEQAITDLIMAGTIYVDETDTGEGLVCDAKLARIEIDVFDRLVAGLHEKIDPESEGVRFDGPRSQAMLPTMNDGQKRAVWGCWVRRIAVLSGGAGVGKTYTMNAVCEVAEENRLRVRLCAPTGKAARKLAHATKREAGTIHRLLEPTFDKERGEFRFSRHAGNMIEADLVIVDEVSMVDVRLMRSLLDALHPQTRLLLVGDHNQIPSVGPGAILRDLLSARARYPMSVHVLREIMRQAGALARNTTALLDGLVVAQTCPAWGFLRTEHGSEEGSAKVVADLVESLLTSPEPLEPFGRHLDPAWDIQVLAPMRAGPLGTIELNLELQRLRQRLLGNPPPDTSPVKAGAKRMPAKPLIGDRVIWTQNDYELDLLNGTQGIVLAISKDGSMELRTEDGRQVTIPSGKRGLVEVAYAMTIHKSQGSEWPCVILCASSSHWIMHDRNLLYTGSSRAAESLTIVGDAGGVKHFAETQRSERRQTLGSMIVNGWRPRDLPQPVVVGVEETTSQAPPEV